MDGRVLPSPEVFLGATEGCREREASGQGWELPADYIRGQTSCSPGPWDRVSLLEGKERAGAPGLESTKG